MRFCIAWTLRCAHFLVDSGNTPLRVPALSRSSALETNRVPAWRSSAEAQPRATPGTYSRYRWGQRERAADSLKFGRAFVVEKNGRWYVVFECRRESSPLPKTGKTVALDRGVHVPAATSEGELIPNGRYGERHRRVVTVHAQALSAASERDDQSRCLNRSDPKRVSAVRRLARAQERSANARCLDALHKPAKRIVENSDTIVIEDLALRSMTRSARGTPESPGAERRSEARSQPSLARRGIWNSSPFDP